MSIYSKNTKLNNLVRAALGLPFVPIERIQNGEAMFLHEGVTTNNYAESYNSKLGRKKVIGSHPNVYLLASVIKEELCEAHDDGDSAALCIEVVMIV